MNDEQEKKTTTYPRLHNSLVGLSLVPPILNIATYTQELSGLNIQLPDFVDVIFILIQILVLFIILAKPSIVWERKAIAFHVGTLFGFIAYYVYAVLQACLMCGTVVGTRVVDAFGVLIFGSSLIATYALTYTLLSKYVRSSIFRKNPASETTSELTPPSDIDGKIGRDILYGSILVTLVLTLTLASPFDPDKSWMPIPSGYVSSEGAPDLSDIIPNIVN